jgi:uncharacterized protein
MKRLADIIIEKRGIFLAVLTALTLFFAYQIVTRLTVKTSFDDLLPTNHPYTKLYYEIRNRFGGANKVVIMIQVRDKEDGGQYTDIFNYETLKKIRDISDDAYKMKAVDPFKVLSLAGNNVKDVKMTAWGMQLTTVMYPDIPETPEQIAQLRRTVYGNPMCYPGLVSLDSKKTIVTLDFFEDKLDYDVCFKELKAIRAKYEDTNHIIAISGEPMHLGYINSYIIDILKVLAYTTIAMMLWFLICFRTKRGMLVPILAAGVSAIWGLGFLSLKKFNLDPLAMVLPFLIAAMAASHAAQVIKRFMEDAAKLGNAKDAAKSVIEHLFTPAFASIITEAGGLIVIALVPIPILNKICIACCYWAFITVVIDMILVPILLSFMPVRALQDKKGLLDRALQGSGRWIAAWGKWPILAVSAFLLVWGTMVSSKLTIGNNVPGSEVFWPWHRYNVDSFRITFAMPLLNPLYIIVESDRPQGIANPRVLRDITSFIRYMSMTPDMRVMFTLSILGQIPGRNQGVNDNDPNWRFTPSEDTQLMLLYRTVIDGGGPGAWDMYIDNEDMVANIMIFCRDKTEETISKVMGRVKDFIRNESVFGFKADDVKREGFDKFVYWIDSMVRKPEPPLPDKPPLPETPVVHYRLAGGAVGVQAAINECLSIYHFWTFAIAVLIVVLCVWVSFKSFVAAILITIPLIISNALALSFMVLMNPPLPLTTATLPVSAVGIGLGVSYGIYLVSRIIEEYKASGGLDDAICTALGTTGKAIIFIATTLTIGIAFWFTSKMMFQALMGLLLAIILIFNMLGALFIVPSLLLVFKPKFITRASK